MKAQKCAAILTGAAMVVGMVPAAAFAEGAAQVADLAAAEGVASDTFGITATQTDVVSGTSNITATPAPVALQTLADVPVEDNTLPTITNLHWSESYSNGIDLYVDLPVDHTDEQYQVYRYGHVVLEFINDTGNLAATSNLLCYTYTDSINVYDTVAGLDAGNYTIRAKFVYDDADGVEHYRYSDSTLQFTYSNPGALTVSNIQITNGVLSFDVSDISRVSYFTADVYECNADGTKGAYTQYSIDISNKSYQSTNVLLYMNGLLSLNKSSFYLEITAHSNDVLKAKDSQPESYTITSEMLEEARTAIYSLSAPTVTTTTYTGTLPIDQAYNLVTLQWEYFEDNETWQNWSCIDAVAVNTETGDERYLDNWYSSNVYNYNRALFLYENGTTRTLSLNYALDELNDYGTAGETYEIYVYGSKLSTIDDNQCVLYYSPRVSVGTYTVPTTTVTAPQQVTYENGVVHVADTYDYPVFYMVEVAKSGQWYSEWLDDYTSDSDIDITGLLKGFSIDDSLEIAVNVYSADLSQARNGLQATASISANITPVEVVAEGVTSDTFGTFYVFNESGLKAALAAIKAESESAGNDVGDGEGSIAHASHVIRLQCDINVTDEIDLPANTTLDLGGHTLTGGVFLPGSQAGSSSGAGNSTGVGASTGASATSTVTNADGSTTTTVTSADGSTAATTTSADGLLVSTTRTDAAGNFVSKTETAISEEKTVVTTTNADKSKTVEAQSANGVVVLAESNAAGELTKFEVTIPETATGAEGVTGGSSAAAAVKLPVSVTSLSGAASDTFAIQINVEGGGAKVEVPVELTGDDAAVEMDNLVAILVDEDVAEQIIKLSGVTDGGLLLNLEGGCSQIKLVENSKTFADVAADAGNDWYADAVSFVSAREIMNGDGGVGATNFAPSTELSCGMMAQILFNLDNADADDIAGTSTFDDTGSAWYAQAANWALEQGITNGYGNGNFGGDDLITREQAVIMLYRYAGEPTADASTLNGFVDAADVSDYAQAAMAWATQAGIITGKNNVNLAAGDIATRAEVAVMAKRFCNYMAKTM
jgi:hypothetical protein